MSRTATGADTIVTYVFEDSGSFAQDPRNSKPTDTDFKAFGSDETFDTQDRDQNSERLYRPFNRQSDEILEGNFAGSWSIDLTLTNLQWLRAVYGDATQPDPTNSPNLYRFELSSANPPRTMHVIEELHYANGDIEQTVYIGAIVTSADLSVSTGDPVNGTIDGDYVTEITRNTGDGDDLIYGDVSNGIGNQPDTQLRPLHFGNSTLSLDYDGDGNAEVQSLIQDADVSFEANAELENELGTRFAVAPSYLNFEPDTSFTGIVNDDDQDIRKKRMYGSSTAKEPQENILDSEIDGSLVFDAGLSSEINTITVNLNGTFPDSYSRSNVGDPSSVIEEDIDRMISRVTVEVETDVYDPTGA